MRPTVYDPCVQAPAIERFLVKLGRSPDDVQAAKDLHDAIAAVGPLGDSCEFVRFLENRHWSADRTFLDDCEGFIMDVEHECEAAVVSWVYTNDVRPRLAVGAAVELVLSAFVAPELRGPQQGAVVRIDARRGHYVVRVPVLGHKLPGELGTQGLVRRFEDLHDICALPEEFLLRAPQTA